MTIHRREFLRLAGAGGCALFSARAVRAAAADGGKTVLVGATARACGMALAHPETTLILESGLHPAPEFTLSLDPETAGTPVSATGRALADALVRDGILSEDGRLYHQPMGYALASFLAARGVTILYAATYAGREPAPDGVRVTAVGYDGPATFTARRVLDTRPGKALALTGVLAREGTSTETRLFRVALPPDADWTRARFALHDAWTARQNEFPGFRLVAEAGAIKRASGFPDFFSAFEEGLKWTGM